MCNGWKKGMKALSLRRQMGAGSFNRCRCSGCCILYQKAKAGIDNNLDSTSGKKERKNAAILSMYKQQQSGDNKTFKRLFKLGNRRKRRSLRFKCRTDFLDGGFTVQSKVTKVRGGWWWTRR